MIKIVVDMMGSDKGSKNFVDAMLRFKKDYPDIELIGVGKKDEISGIKEYCEIVEANEIVPMDAGTLETLRLKNASMNVGLKYMKENNCDAFISAGSTGGLLSAATIALRTIPGVKRSALLACLPTVIPNKKMAVLDLGASNENSPEELVQFASLGSLYYQFMFNVKCPKVFLLSNGREAEKGSPNLKKAHEILSNQKFNGFSGNIEARYALNGDVDVLVTDGFSGNIFLKTVEGLSKTFFLLLKEAFNKNLWTKIGALHVKNELKNIKNNFDYKGTGGALFIGLNGLVIKAHGSSNDVAIYSALLQAKTLAEAHIVEKIKEVFKNE